MSLYLSSSSRAASSSRDRVGGAKDWVSDSDHNKTVQDQGQHPQSKLGKVGEGAGSGGGDLGDLGERCPTCLSGRTLTIGYTVRQHSGAFCKLPLAPADKVVAPPSPSLPKLSYLSERVDKEYISFPENTI